MGQGQVSLGKHTDRSRFQSRTLFAGLEQGDGAPKLWFAVLAQAFRDYYGDIPSEGPGCYRKVQVHYCQRMARAWFRSNSPSMGSFRWVAELFELDVQAVRKRLFSGARIDLGEAIEEAAPQASAAVVVEERRRHAAGVDDVALDDEVSNSSIEAAAFSGAVSLQAMAASEPPLIESGEELPDAASIRYPTMTMVHA